MHSGSIWARLVSISSHRQQSKWYMRVIRCVTIVSREVFFPLRLCSLMSLITELRDCPLSKTKLEKTAWFPREMASQERAKKFRTDDVVYLIGWIKFPTRHDQSEVLPRSGYWHIISMKCLRSFLRRHFASRKQWWRREMLTFSLGLPQTLRRLVFKGNFYSFLFFRLKS